MSTKMPMLLRVLSETSRLISASSCRFLALAAPFLVLISFSTTIYLFLPHTPSLLSYYHQLISSFSLPHSETPPTEISQLVKFLYSLPSPIFNFYLLTSTSHSTVHKFHNRAVNFISSLKSIIVSFLPLLLPKLVHMIILELILFAFGILMLLQYTMLVLLGCNMDYNSIHFLVFILRIVTFLAGLLIYLGVELCLMNPISQRGFSPLKYLAKGMKWVTFLVIMLSELLLGILSIWYLIMMANYAGNHFHGPTGWLVVQTLVYVIFMLILLFYNHVAETVFRRVLLGEIALLGDSTSQIDEKSGGETVC